MFRRKLHKVLSVPGWWYCHKPEGGVNAMGYFTEARFSQHILKSGNKH